VEAALDFVDVPEDEDTDAMALSALIRDTGRRDRGHVNECRDPLSEWLNGELSGDH
jgi:hypothetical protein